jgi:hypothetical protein
MPENPQQEEISLAKLAKDGLDRILKLSQSQLISEKLQSFNILLVTFILAVVITHFLIGSTGTSLTVAIFLVFSFILALILSLGYGPVLSIVTNVSSNKVEGLRAGAIILFISLTCAVASLTFDVELLAQLSLVLIGVQLVLIPLSSIIFPKSSILDKKVEPNQLWTAMGRIETIVGLISFVLDIILIIAMF